MPYWRAKWQMEQDVAASGLEHVIFRPSFVFGEGRRHPADLHPAGALLAGRHGARARAPRGCSRSGSATSPRYFARALDLADAANRTFELGGPDTVTWNDALPRASPACSVSGACSSTCRSRSRAPARALTQSLPRSPLSVDQVTMLEAGDNVVTATTRRTFACRSSASTSRSAVPSRLGRALQCEPFARESPARRTRSASRSRRAGRPGSPDKDRGPPRAALDPETSLDFVEALPAGVASQRRVVRVPHAG